MVTLCRNDVYRYELDRTPVKKRYPYTKIISHYPHPERHRFDNPSLVYPEIDIGEEEKKRRFLIEEEKKRIYLCKEYPRDMTYILGARCVDGVVLVGDTKITGGRGVRPIYIEKIDYPFYTAVWGSAGTTGIFREFRARVMVEVDQKNRLNAPITSEEMFHVLICDKIQDMKNIYGNDRNQVIYGLNVFCASRISTGSAQLVKFNGNGYFEPVNQIDAIGQGQYYEKLFIDRLWNPSMTMEQTAKLGLFIIECIQQLKLDNTIGYTEEFLPQVAVIPDIDSGKKQSGIEGLSPEKIKQYIEEIKPKATKFEKWLDTELKI